MPKPVTSWSDAANRPINPCHVLELPLAAMPVASKIAPVSHVKPPKPNTIMLQISERTPSKINARAISVTPPGRCFTGVSLSMFNNVSSRRNPAQEYVRTLQRFVRLQGAC